MFYAFSDSIGRLSTDILGAARNTQSCGYDSGKYYEKRCISSLLMLDGWKTACKSCHFYNKRASRVNSECLVYAQRPVACRTYGFYVQRDLVLYCKEIESCVTDGALAEVVWGNHDIIDHQLRDLGEPRDLTEWFDGWYGS